MFTNLILNVFISVLLFGGISIILFLILRKLLSPKKITALGASIKSSNFKQSIKLAKEIISKEPNNVEAHYYLAESYYNEGKYELALIEYKATDKIGVYDKHINEVDLREKLADLSSKFDNLDEALKEYALLHNQYPNDFNFSFKMGDLFERKNMREQAIVYYTKSYKENPNYVPLLVNIGVLLYENKKFNEAIKYLEIAVKIEPANYKAHLYLGLLMKAESNYKGAIKHLEIAVRDKDYKVRALMEKGMILLSSNKYDEAVIELERALKNSDSDKSVMTLNIRYILATCYEQMRNLTEAIMHWEKIYSVKPDFKNVGEKLASFQELRMDDKMKDFMTATNDEFLDICKKIIATMGLNIYETKILSPEGIEFFALEGNEKWRNTKKKPKLIHIYRKSTPIEESLIRKLHEGMREKEIIKGVIITASSFSKQAMIFAQERPIELIDKNGLQNMLRTTIF